MSDTLIVGGSPFLRKLVRNISLPQRVLGFLLMLLLIYFVLMPAINLVYTAFSYSIADRRLPQVVDAGREVVPGQFTLVHFQRVFASALTKKMFLLPLRNTMIITLGLTITALFIGSLLAWVMVRSNLPGKRILASLAAIPYIIPSWPIALAWINIFKNSKIGGSIGWFEYLSGITPPDWLSYGPVPIIICLSLHYYAYAFITVSGALASIDSRLEETGELLGASRLQVMRKITLPLVLPSISISLYLNIFKGYRHLRYPGLSGASRALFHPIHAAVQ